MKINIQGLGGRLQRARKDAELSQMAVGERIGVSWMTVLRWEKAQRSISEENLALICKLYDRPLRWFLTLEEGDLADESRPSGDEPSAAANRLSRSIAEAPASQRPIIEKVVEDILDGLRRAS